MLYLGAENHVLGSGCSIPLEPVVILSRAVVGLGVADVHAERMVLVDSNDVWQGPCAALGSVELK